MAGLACPRPQDLPALVGTGIGALLSLTARPVARSGEVPGLEVRHDPVVDFQPPSQAQLLAVVTWMRRQLAADRAVAVHCMAGMGRTGTVLAAWLVAEGVAPEAAVAEVRRRRPGSIETAAQEAAVHAFATTWRRAGTARGEDA